MNTATGYESGVPVSCVDTSHALAPITKQIRVTRPQRYYVAAFAIALPALFIGLPNRGVKDVVQLERLAPKIERAQALSPDARETIGRLVSTHRSKDLEDALSAQKSYWKFIGIMITIGLSFYAIIFLIGGLGMMFH